MHPSSVSLENSDWYSMWLSFDSIRILPQDFLNPLLSLNVNFQGCGRAVSKYRVGWFESNEASMQRCKSQRWRQSISTDREHPNPDPGYSEVNCNPSRKKSVLEFQFCFFSEWVSWDHLVGGSFMGSDDCPCFPCRKTTWAWANTVFMPKQMLKINVCFRHLCCNALCHLQTLCLNRSCLYYLTLITVSWLEQGWTSYSKRSMYRLASDQSLVMSGSERWAGLLRFHPWEFGIWQFWTWVRSRGR